MFGRCCQILLQESDSLPGVVRSLSRTTATSSPTVLSTRNPRSVPSASLVILSRPLLTWTKFGDSQNKLNFRQKMQPSRLISQHPKKYQQPINSSRQDTQRRVSQQEPTQTLHGIPQSGYRMVHAAHAFVKESYCEDEPYSGPDQILPSVSNKCWNAEHTVDLQMTSSGLASTAPTSVYSFLERTAVQYPESKAMVVKRGGQWISWNYRDYFEDSCTVAKAFIKLGLERHHGVCIMGFNSPEWFITNFGSIFAGGLSVGVYQNNSAEACILLAKDSQAQVVVVDTEDTVDKFMSIKDQLPHLKVIVQWIGTPAVPGVLSWKDLLAIGKHETSEALNDRLKLQGVNQCCSLIYTSGTTGTPKGVMCSQDNLTWTSKKYSDFLDINNSNETFISYLPLNHIAGQLIDIYFPIPKASTVYFAQPDALRGSIGATLAEVQPTRFFTVPRLLEKMYDRLRVEIENKGVAKKTLLKWARSQAFNYHNTIINGGVPSQFELYNYKLAKSLALDKVKSALGLSQIRSFGLGSAPVDDNILDFFLSLDLPLINCFGLSETQSCGSMGDLVKSAYRQHSVGKVVPFVEIQIKENAQASGQVSGEGEICFRGRSIFMGYLNCQEKTEETIQENGWMLSGDLGYFDNEDFLYVTGRAKEIIITAGGENVAPVPIELAVKKELPVLSNSIVCGDKRKYLSLLITLQCDLDIDSGLPQDTLLPHVVNWLHSLGSQSTTVTQLRQELNSEPNGAVASEIQRAIDRYNEHAWTPVHRVRRWALLPRDFSIPAGELSNTLKLKRSYVTLLYQHLIDSLYKDEQGCGCDSAYNL